MKILITGGAGFIGLSLVRHHMRLGHEVVVVDNLTTGKKELLPPSVTLHQSPIWDRAAMSDIIRAENPDVISHHAATTNFEHCENNPEDAWLINVEGTESIISAATGTGVKNFIFASSSAVYGNNQNLPAKESEPLLPISVYGRSKLAAEEIIKAESEKQNLSYVIFRYANAYGPGNKLKGSQAGVMALFAEAMRQGRRPTIFGDGSSSRDYIHTDDIARANEAALYATKNLILNIGSGKGVSINELYRLVATEMNFRQQAIYEDARPGEIEHMILDSSLAKKELGWQPKTTLEEGIKGSI